MLLTKKKVVDLARKYLEPHQPADYRIEVSPQGVQRLDDFWYVVVKPSREDVQSYDLGARLADASIDLEKREKVHVLYTTVMPQRTSGNGAGGRRIAVG
jgi:hypothetical protein